MTDGPGGSALPAAIEALWPSRELSVNTGLPAACPFAPNPPPPPYRSAPVNSQYRDGSTLCGFWRNASYSRSRNSMLYGSDTFGPGMMTMRSGGGNGC